MWQFFSQKMLKNIFCLNYSDAWFYCNFVEFEQVGKTDTQLSKAFLSPILAISLLAISSLVSIMNLFTLWVFCIIIQTFMKNVQK